MRAHAHLPVHTTPELCAASPFVVLYVSRNLGTVYSLEGTWCFTSAETIRLIRDGRMEEGEEGDYVSTAILCHHQNDSCIKMGSDESQFNISLIVRDKVTKSVSINHNF